MMLEPISPPMIGTKMLPLDPGVPGVEPSEPGVPGVEPSEPGVPGVEPSEPGVPGVEPSEPGVVEPSDPGGRDPGGVSPGGVQPQCCSRQCPFCYGVGEGRAAPLPASGEGPLGQQCMLDSEPHPLGLRGIASAVPALLEPTSAQRCHRFALTGRSAGLGPGPQGPWPGQPLVLLPPRSRGGGQRERTLARSPLAGAVGNPLW